MNDKLISKYIHLAEKTLLIFIAFATIYATVQEIYELVKIKRVLLLFKKNSMVRSRRNSFFTGGSIKKTIKSCI